MHRATPFAERSCTTTHCLDDANGDIVSKINTEAFMIHLSKGAARLPGSPIALALFRMAIELDAGGTWWRFLHFRRCRIC